VESLPVDPGADATRATDGRPERKVTIMIDMSPVSLEGIFSALSTTLDQRTSLSTSALNRGASLLQERRYDAAIQEFKRAVGLNPESIDAYIIMGRTYSLMGQSTDAIDAFQNAVKVDPTTVEARTYLAGALVGAQRYGEAEVQYKTVINLDGSAVAPHSSLGSLYLLMERYAEAETQFQKVGAMTPLDPNSYYNLGLVYNKQERYSEAVNQFERVLGLQPGSTDAIAEMAYSYLGLGLEDQAIERVTTLWNLDTNESWVRAAEIEAVMFTPKIQYADTAKSTFNPYLISGAWVSLLDPSLSTPGASKMFSMVFRFNQEMDLASVQSAMNWSINRATGGVGGVYNSGATLYSDREVGIMPFPLAVRYDPDTREATVYFRITQNATGDGLIDPQHWVFRFSGTDVTGKSIDPLGDEYDGFARTPF
jgi:tetratricopeptide (TPR) repeat protein